MRIFVLLLFCLFNSAAQALPSGFERVSGFESFAPFHGGPNCFNLALVLNHILPSLRFSSPDEIGFYINSPLCRKLQDGEPRRYGDIGLIYLSSKKPIEEYHGFIYINENLAYSKNGDGIFKPSSYLLQSLENVYNTYDVPLTSECRQNQLKIPSRCGQAASFHRCESMQNYLSRKPKLSMPIQKINKAVLNFEKDLESFAIYDKQISWSAQKSIKHASKEFSKYLKNSRNEKLPLDCHGQFILGVLQMHFEGISEQLAYSTIFINDYKILSDQLKQTAQDAQIFIQTHVATGTCQG